MRDRLVEISFDFEIWLPFDMMNTQRESKTIQTVIISTEEDLPKKAQKAAYEYLYREYRLYGTLITKLNYKLLDKN